MHVRLLGLSLLVVAGCSDETRDAEPTRVSTRVSSPAEERSGGVAEEHERAESEREPAGDESDDAIADEERGEDEVEAVEELEELGGQGDHGSSAGPLAVREGAGETEMAAHEMIEREGLHLTELVLGSAIESRRPVDPGTRFSKSEHDRVYCYVRIANPEREETQIHIDWEPADAPREGPGRPLDVPASREYVTFAFTGTRGPPGRYRCVVRDAGGEVIGRAEYELTE